MLKMSYYIIPTQYLPPKNKSRPFPKISLRVWAAILGYIFSNLSFPLISKPLYQNFIYLFGTNVKMHSKTSVEYFLMAFS